MCVGEWTAAKSVEFKATGGLVSQQIALHLFHLFPLAYRQLHALVFSTFRKLTTRNLSFLFLGQPHTLMQLLAAMRNAGVSWFFNPLIRPCGVCISFTM